MGLVGLVVVVPDGTGLEVVTVPGGVGLVVPDGLLVVAAGLVVVCCAGGRVVTAGVSKIGIGIHHADDTDRS